MKNTIFFLFFFLIFAEANSQTYTIREVTTLPNQIDESSGLEIENDNSLWTHNDDGSPELFCFDTLGNITRIVTITNATNIDWEDITRDESGNIYIGDFGNNDNDRSDLKIYKIPNPETFSQNSIEAEIINFSYADQTSFPPSSANLNYDVEAMIWRENSLFLFTKNRSEPSNGYSKLYKLPAENGTYSAELIDSLFTDTKKSTGRVTAADINNDSNQLALLTKQRVYYFENFVGNDFFSGDKIIFELANNSSKEGLCFINNEEFFITDETEKKDGGILYRMNISSSISTSVSENKMEIAEVEIFPNPTSDFLSVTSSEFEMIKGFEIYNIEGELMIFQNFQENRNEILLNVESFNRGQYLIRIIAEKNFCSKMFIVK